MADQFTWTAADGTVTVLSDTGAGFTVLDEGTRGLRSVEYDVAAQRYAGIDGETVQSIRAVGNRPTLGLLIEADTEAEFRQRSRALRRAMRPKVGPGVLSYADSTGEVRELACYCIGGFEGDDAQTSQPGRWWRLALKFYAPSPWWEGPEQAIVAGLADTTTTPFFPLPPLRLSGSLVVGRFEVDLSDADAPSFPLWTVTGPATALTLTNESTGQVIQVNATLGPGDVMVIDTRPSYQSVRLTSGVNLMGSLASDPALWPLRERLNVITATITGATSDSSITGTYRPRYAGI